MRNLKTPRAQKIRPIWVPAGTVLGTPTVRDSVRPIDLGSRRSMARWDRIGRAITTSHRTRPSEAGKVVLGPLSHALMVRTYDPKTQFVICYEAKTQHGDEKHIVFRVMAEDILNRRSED